MTSVAGNRQTRAAAGAVANVTMAAIAKSNGENIAASGEI